MKCERIYSFILNEYRLQTRFSWEVELMEITTKTAVDQFQFASDKASEICRQLAFAAFAIAWIFRIQLDNGSTVPALLAYGTALATTVLLLDLLQYVFSAAALQSALQREGVSDEEKVINVTASGVFSSIIFYGKIVLTAIAYALILKFFVVTLL